VVFVDGDAGAPYLTVPMTASGAAGAPVTMTPPRSLDGLTSHALDTRLTLLRPDGKTPPAKSGLRVPAPPPAARDVFTVDTLGPVQSPPSLNTRMMSRNAGVVLNAAGIVARYGSFDGARSAPPGQQLLAFQFTLIPGDVEEGFFTEAYVVVNGGKPLEVPQTDVSDDWDILGINTGASAVLELRDGGYTQTLALPNGTPGPNNLHVLGRRNRLDVLNRNADVPVTLSNGSNSVSVTWHARATVATLSYWAPGHAQHHASGPDRAILWLHLTYTDPNVAHTVFGFEPRMLRLLLPDGERVHAYNIAKRDKIFDVFDVPADFTGGTVQVTGSAQLPGFSITAQRTVSFPISIPAG
jgi:hypothetical protein